MRPRRSPVRRFLRSVARLLFAGSRRNDGRKDILLACHNTLTATYLQELWAILKHDPRLRFSIVLKRPEESLGDWSRIKECLPLPILNQWQANIRPWDLVVMASHAGAFAPLAEPWRHPVLRISHGIGGKLSQGEDYFYGSGTRDYRGRIIYSCMFESSRWRAQQAVATNPALADRIAVVGSLRADQLATAVANPARRPFDKRRPAVLIASSWGKGNLFEKFASPLWPTLKSLCLDYDVTLRPHPKLLASRGAGQIDWTHPFPSVRISPPHEPLAQVLGSTDVLVTDDLSSVGLFAVTAGIRVVLVPSNSPAVGTDTFLVRLRQLAPVVEAPTDLAKALRHVFQTWPPPGLATLASDINSEPGRAALLMRQEIYKLMRIPEFVTT